LAFHASQSYGLKPIPISYDEGNIKHSVVNLAASGVRYIDVMILPFVVVMSLNIALLTAWTVVNTLTWVHVSKESFELFGQVVETYGTCAVNNNDPTNDKTICTKILFTSLILIVNFVALMCVLYQCYRAQQLPPVKPSTWGCQWL
jgi:hypothetical protein